MHASSESGLLCSSSGASASGRFWIGHTVWPVLASCSTMWRWLNVPRSVSCPVRRSGTPSVSSDANASASACAQSMFGSDAALSASASWRRSSCLTSFGCTVKPSGTRSSCTPSSRRRVAGTAVSTSGLGERSSWYSPVTCSPSCSAASAIFAFRRWCSSVRLSHTSCAWRSTSSLETTPSVTRRSAHSSYTRFFVLIFAYISGCVYAGSSDSLCPKRR